MMTLSGYTSSGGVRGAIAETAEAVFTDQFKPEQRADRPPHLPAADRAG